MKIKLNEKEILEIVGNHLATQGFKTEVLKISLCDKEEYEYFGDPTREDRRKIKCRYFDGVEAEVTIKIKLRFRGYLFFSIKAKIVYTKTFECAIFNERGISKSKNFYLLGRV